MNDALVFEAGTSASVTQFVIFLRRSKVDEQLLGLCVVRRLSDSAPEFLEPFGLILSMDHAAQESKRFGDIVAVEPNVLTGRLGVLPHPLFDVRGLGKDVGCVAGLRHLDDYRFFEIKNVFVAEYVHRSRALI